MNGSMTANPTSAWPGWRLILLCQLAALAASVATLRLENRYFEFCTTKAFGWPAPWRWQWCLCEQGSWTGQPGWWLVNVVFAALAGLLLAVLLKLGWSFVGRQPAGDAAAGGRALSE
jgi:hypothetical protein